MELEDGSIANVEDQKISYLFPGERSTCYSAVLLLRQYKRVRGQKQKKFSYKDIKNVFTIVFFEQSPKEFHSFSKVSLYSSCHPLLYTDKIYIVKLIMKQKLHYYFV